MYPNQIDTSPRLRRLILLIFWVVAIYCIYSVVSAALIKRSTGVLNVSSNVIGASIIISQDQRDSRLAGTGSASVRLKPGKYQIYVYANDYQRAEEVTIYKGSVIDRKINLIGAASKKNGNGIFDLLPYIGPGADYYISSTPITEGGGSGPSITITEYDNKSGQDALEWIRSLGYDPNDYIINHVPMTAGNGL